MDGWSDEWFRNDAGHGASGGRGPGNRPGHTERAPTGEPTVQLPHPAAASRTAAGAVGGAAAGHDAPPGTGWPAQPPGHRSRIRGGPGRGKRIFIIFTAVLALVLVGTVGMYFYLDSKLNRVAALADYPGRPTGSAGQNWLITGSDSRQGLTRAQIRKLATGYGIGGQRSDTIMLLHLPANGGPPVLVSLPRDSYVPIPGYGDNKLNAAFSFGGPVLLARTVQNITGLHIDHYMGIGFGGFVSVVDAVGGVRMCLKTSLNDPAAGLHLHAGCQVLDGAQALGFVRSRHLYATQDLQRIQNQRSFLRALLAKMTSTGVLLNPFSSIPAGTGVAGSLTVDSGTSLYQLLQVAFALRNPVSTTVPIGNSNYITQNAGDALLWDHAAALRLFNALRNDQPVPKDLISGSTPGG
jgi:LCP family protein required for cell wall assembly